LKEHSVSHSKVHHDLPNDNKLAELDIGRLEQIVEAVVKTQRDLSRNGQKFCGTENLSHSNTNSSNLHSETQAPSELGDDKQVSILYQQQPSDLSGSSKEKCINHRSRRTMKSYSDSVPNAMQTLHRNPLSTQELEISRAGDRSMSSLSSSQYHDESRRTIDVDTGNETHANSRGNNLSDLSSSASSSHGSNLAHGAAIKGQFDTRFNRFTVTETADYVSTSQSKSLGQQNEERQDESGDSILQTTKAYSSAHKCNTAPKLTIKDTTLSWANDVEDQNSSSSCSDGDDDSEQKAAASQDVCHTNSDDSFYLESVSSSQKAVCPCICTAGTEHEQKMKRSWMELLERKPKYPNEQAMKMWLLQVMDTVRR